MAAANQYLFGIPPKATQLEQSNWRMINKKIIDLEGDINSLSDSSSVSTVGNIYYQFVAANNLGGHRIVYKNSAGKVDYASKDTIAQAPFVIGMNVNAVSAGEMANVLIFGEIEELSWSWTPSQTLFLSTNGLLTQTAPTSGTILKLGIPITPTKILIEIGMPVYST